MFFHGEDFYDANFVVTLQLALQHNDIYIKIKCCPLVNKNIWSCILEFEIKKLHKNVFNKFGPIKLVVAILTTQSQLFHYYTYINHTKWYINHFCGAEVHLHNVIFIFTVRFHKKQSNLQNRTIVQKKVIICHIIM